LLGWLQRQPQIVRVWATTDHANARSAAVLRKLGLQLEGVMRQATLRPNLGGPPRDTCLYAWVRSNAPGAVESTILMKLHVHGPNGPAEAYAYTGGKPFDPTLPCVVFIHGAVNDHSVWTLLARWFAHHGHSVLALDLPGHKRSAGPGSGQCAGHGRLGAGLHDGRWRATGGPGRPQPGFIDRAAGGGTGTRTRHPSGHAGHLCAHAGAAAAAGLVAQRCLGSHRPRGDVFLFDTRGQAFLSRARRVVAWRRTRPDAPGDAGARGHTPFSYRLQRLQQLRHGLQAAAQVQCPAGLVLGQYDQMTLPKSAREVTQLLKATVHTVPAGHFVMQESPDPVLAALRSLWH
jgi:pimeloyl-ACP methyl ester carboxylesterase